MAKPSGKKVARAIAMRQKGKSYGEIARQV